MKRRRNKRKRLEIPPPRVRHPEGRTSPIHPIVDELLGDSELARVSRLEAGKVICLYLPAGVLQWLSAEAPRHSVSRSQFVAFCLAFFNAHRREAQLLIR